MGRLKIYPWEPGKKAIFVHFFNQQNLLFSVTTDFTRNRKMMSFLDAPLLIEKKIFLKSILNKNVHKNKVRREGGFSLVSSQNGPMINVPCKLKKLAAKESQHPLNLKLPHNHNGEFSTMVPAHYDIWFNL